MQKNCWLSKDDRQKSKSNCKNKSNDKSKRRSFGSAQDDSFEVITE